MGESESNLLILSNFSSVINIFRPFDFSAIYGFVIIIILLIFSGLISGAEIAFFSLNHSFLKKIENSSLQTDKLMIQLLEKPKRLLAIVLVSNNFINVAIVLISAWLSGILFDFSLNPTLGFFIQVIFITSIILLFGEIMPKIYARQKAIPFARMMTKPLSILGKIFKPLVNILVFSTNIIDKSMLNKKALLTMSELSEVVEIAHANKNKSELGEAKILKSITTYGETEVKEIMVARVDVFAIDISTHTNQLIELIKEQGYSRIPVFKENFDEVVGILYIKDLLSHLNNELFHWQDFIREVIFVPENKKINDLLQEFKKKKIHMAVVVDEYGGTSGIVTLEDILEEIVGEISDEFDIQEDDISYKKIDEKTWVFEAKTSINDLCKIINIDAYFFDKVKGESDSLAGLILELKGEFPKTNDIIKYNNIEFEVLMMDNRRIKRVKLSMI